MADAASMSEYNKSGFSSAAGTGPLKNEKSNIPTTDDALRAQAEQQYKDTYDALDRSFSQQLTGLITSQATDEKLLNEQYNNSVSSMLAELQKRGLHVTGSLPEAQTAAINQHRNEVLATRANIYEVQRRLPEARQKLLHDNYDIEVRKRMAQNRETNVPQLSDLLTKLAQLQSASFNDYINYLLAKKAKSSGGGGGGGGYYRSSSGSTGLSSSGYVDPGQLSGDNYYVVTDDTPPTMRGVVQARTRAQKNGQQSKNNNKSWQQRKQDELMKQRDNNNRT